MMMSTIAMLIAAVVAECGSGERNVAVAVVLVVALGTVVALRKHSEDEPDHKRRSTTLLLLRMVQSWFPVGAILKMIMFNPYIWVFLIMKM